MEATLALFFLLFTPFLIGCIWLLMVPIPIYFLTRISIWVLNNLIRPIFLGISTIIPFGIGRIFASLICFLLIGTITLLILILVFLPLWWFVLMAACGKVWYMTEKVLTEKERQEEIKRLTAIKEEAEHNANLQDVQQHAYKIFLNSVYRLYWDRIFSGI